jgi:hypothetical protein
MVLLDRLRRNDKTYTELAFYEGDFVRTDNFLDLVTAILTNTVVHTVCFHDCVNPKWSSKQVKLLFSAIARLPNLQVMSISRTTVTLQSLAVVVEKSVRLQELHVWESKLVASEHDVRLFASALKRTHLNAIDLKRVSFGGDGNLDPLFATCQEYLTSLKLDHVLWREGAVSNDVFRMLQTTKLVELAIENVPLHNGQLCAIAEGLKRNKSLKIFTLRNIVISNTAAKQFADALSVNDRLNRLCLSGCSLSDGAAKYVAEMLHSNATLTCLALPFNEIGDEGVIDLADALLHSCVQDFEIQSNGNMEELGIQALVQLAEESSRLQSMKVFVMSRQSSTLEQLDIQQRIDSCMNLNVRTSDITCNSRKRRKVWYE